MNITTRLTLIAFILFMSRGMIGPLSSLYATSLGANYVTLSILDMVSSLTMIGASALWGYVSDKLQQRKVFLVGGLVSLALGYAVVALVPHYGYLFPLYILAAVAQPAYNIGSLALMGDVLESRVQGRGRRMGTYRGLASLGFGLMAFISGGIADAFSLRVPFVLAAVLFGIACVLALGVKEAHQDSTSQASVMQVHTKSESLKEIDKSPLSEDADLPVCLKQQGQNGDGRLPLFPLLLAAFLWSLVTIPVYAVWGNYMVEDLLYTPTQMTRLWALASLSEFPLMILAGWLSDRVGRLPMLSLGFVAWTLVFVGYVTVPVLPWIVLVQLVRGFAYSAHTATAMTYAAEVRARAQRGRASGLYSAAGGLGAILGASMGGILAQTMGIRVMIAVNAAIIFAGAVYLAVQAIKYRGQVK